MKNILLTSVFSIIVLVSAGQEADAFLTKFFAVQVDESVLIRWTMSAGSTCSDTQIERSDDGINYEKIGLIGGICGSPDEEMTFEFTDTLPLVNQTAYYRLLLGYFGYTSPEILEFVWLNEQGYFLGPNPFNEYVRIAFDNEDKEEYNLTIVDMFGRQVLKMWTGDDEFLILRKDLNAGSYTIMLKKDGKMLFTDKIIAY